MLLRIKTNRQYGNPPAPAGHVRTLFKSGALAWLVLFAALPASNLLHSQAGPNPNQPIPGPDASRPLDANQIMTMHDQQSKKANVQAANVERKRQIADDSAKLLKLATDLKAEVDKTSKDTLSLGVIRKAEEIEKLAHSVKEKMKLSMSSGN
jgi:hypothetical protein